MYKLYYHPLSFPSLAPIFTASAIGATYETQVIDLGQGEQSSDEFLAINPFGKVPAIEHDGFSIGESAAIMRYIARQSKSDLYPQTPREQALVEQWMGYVNHHIRGPMASYHFNLKLADIFGATPDPHAMARGQKTLKANLPTLEKALTDNPYLCGDDMSLADIALLAALEPVEMSGTDISQYQALKTWRAARRGEAFYTDVHSHYGAEVGL